MVELTTAASARLEEYLSEVRRVLRGAGQLEPGEVEADIREHVGLALADAATGAPVDLPRLEAVLRSLGAPSAWVEGPTRVANSPRAPAPSPPSQSAESAAELPFLPVASLFTFVIGLALAFVTNTFLPGLCVFAAGCLGSFLLARAWLASQTGPVTNARLWLVTPGLASVYLPLLLAFGLAPIAPFALYWMDREQALHHQLARKAEFKKTADYLATFAKDQIDRGQINTAERIKIQRDELMDQENEIIENLSAMLNFRFNVVLVGAIVTIAWWITVGFARQRLGRLLASVFTPFQPTTIARALVLANVAASTLAALCFTSAA